MTGEEFLRAWAAEIVASAELQWHQRFYAIVEALEIVDEIDIDAAREIGQGVRAGLTARTGEPTSDFYLGSRRAPPRPRRGPAVPPATHAPQLVVRAAAGLLPPSLGDGGTKFISVEGDRAWLVCSGAGPAPWPLNRPGFRPLGAAEGSAPVRGLIRSESASPPIGPPSPPFLDVVDNSGRHYRLSHDSSSTPTRGEKRPRWELRATIEPPPDEDIEWMEFQTDQEPVRVPLRPPVQAETITAPLDPVPSALEHHLNAQIHNHVWLHLLDPGRPLDPLGVVAAAVIAVGAIDVGHPLVQAIFAVDAALAGAATSSALPAAVATALRPRDQSSPWLGVEALGVQVELDGVFVTLEALVGHRDRLALHFVQAPTPFPPSDASDAHRLVVWGTDDLGGGYVGHAEPLGGMDQGAYHLRPPLTASATVLTIHLQGATHQATVDIHLPYDLS